MTRQAAQEFAPAKINLYLHVLGRRGDGYHALESLVAFADTGDRLTFTPDADWRLEVGGPFAAALVASDDNLVLQAARAYGQAVKDATPGRLMLEKNLPVASGLGGGSADAAATLRLLDRLNEGRGRALLPALAERLGSDVPVCLSGKPSMMSGRGEQLAPVNLLPLHAVLVNPGIAVSTKQIFQLLAAPALAEGQSHAPARVPGGDVIAFVQAQRNDLETPALTLAPAIADCRAALRAIDGCLLARMSGSGATVFGLFQDAAQASTAAAAIAKAKPDWWVRATVLR